MIITVDRTNLLQAAMIHSISWKESHRFVCVPDFVEMHTPERQQKYMQNKMNCGSKFYMLVEDIPVGVISVRESLIEDLYIYQINRKWARARSCCDTLLSNALVSPLYGYSKTISMQNGCITKWDFKKQVEVMQSQRGWMRLNFH